MQKNLITNRIIMLVLLCYPILLLTVKGGMNGLFFLLLITSVFCLFRTPKPLPTSLWDSYSIAFAIAMSSPMLAVFLSQAYHGAFTAPPYDAPSRFLLAIPIFLALRQVKMSTITMLQYGLPLGALSALLYAVFNLRTWNDGLDFVNHIHFGDSVLMLGFLSVLAINWQQRDRALVLILKICGLLAGVYLSVRSGTRGGWAAIPVFIIILFLSRNPEKPWHKLAAALLSVLLLAVLSYVLNDTVHQRLDMIYHDLAGYYHGNKDTSIGVRLQLWQAALYLFVQHPIFGVGPDGFAQMMAPLSDSGMLTTTAASLGRGEVHNEILAKTAGMGIFGLLSILSIYAVPFIIFVRSTRSPVAQIRAAAFIGTCMVAGYFIFGLTVEIFNLKMTAAFYSLTVAVLLAAATHKTASQVSHV
ncbi:MAG: O-antigen ligase family protein [Gallionella sp.]